MEYNGWTNRETWLVNVWFNPEKKSDIDFARESIEQDVNNLPDYLKDFIDINSIDWRQLYDHVQNDDDDEIDD